MSNRYSLKPSFAFRTLPRNIKYIRFGFPSYHFQARQQIGPRVGNLSINPGFVSENHILFWPNGVYGVKSNMCLGRPTARSFKILKEDRQNLHAFERVVGVVT